MNSEPGLDASTTHPHETTNDTPANSVGNHAYAHEHSARHRVLRIRIIDAGSKRLKVSLTLPAGLVNVATRMGARLVPPTHDIVNLVAAIDRGELQLPVVLQDAQHDEQIEIDVDS